MWTRYMTAVHLVDYGIIVLALKHMQCKNSMQLTHAASNVHKANLQQ